MAATKELSRRSFLVNSSAMALAGTASSAFKGAAAAKESKRSSDIIGCYSSVKDILEDPGYIDTLGKKLGVNVLLVGSPIRMPAWLREMNPLEGGRSMFALHTDDDSALIRAIEETHRRGMKLWLYFSGHHNSKEDRNVMAETFDGVKFADLPQIKYALSQGELTTCFEKPRVRAYVQQLFGYASKHYDVDKMYVSHTRYATPSFWTNLFGCACADCRRAAYDMGYDFDSIKMSMKKLRTSLENLDRKTVEHAVRARMTFGDFLSLLGEDNGVTDWLYFRASVVGNALRRMHDVVHESTDHRCGFVTDTHNPTMSLLIGHNYKELIGGASDGLHPLSWCAYQHISVVAAWANQLCEWVDGLDESTALKAVTAFFGWDGLGLPDTKISGLRIGKSSQEHSLFGDTAKSFYGYFNPDLTIKLMTHEWSRMAALNRNRVPAHPVMKGTEWPEKVCETLIECIGELGLDGYVYQGTGNYIKRG